MENFFFFWLAVAAMFLILEIGSPGLFYFLSFSIGAGATAFASFYLDPLHVQALVFLITTIVALIALKYCIRSWNKSHKQSITNIYALQGKHGLVLFDIAAQSPGTVKVDGQIWSAKALQDAPIYAGATIEVVSCTGAFLIVREIHT